jgi:hypothetical protein
MFVNFAKFNKLEVKSNNLYQTLKNKRNEGNMICDTCNIYSLSVSSRIIVLARSFCKAHSILLGQADIAHLYTITQV